MEQSISLGSQATINQGELFAILKAVDLLAWGPQAKVLLHSERRRRESLASPGKMNLTSYCPALASNKIL